MLITKMKVTWSIHILQTSAKMDKCYICNENQRDCALIPCGHEDICLRCASNLKECHHCRKPIKDRLHTYSTQYPWELRTNNLIHLRDDFIIIVNQFFTFCSYNLLLSGSVNVNSLLFSLFCKTVNFYCFTSNLYCMHIFLRICILWA